MNITRTADSSSEVLSLNDVKKHLRITSTDDDEALRQFIAAIRHKTETYLGKTLFTATWVAKFDCFSDEIELPMHPVQSITSVSYVDTDGAGQTLDSSGYQFDRSGRLKPSYSNTWPDTREQYDAVTVTYVAGESDSANINEDIKLAMLLWIGSCDMNRENEIIGTIISPIPDGAKNILNMYRDWQL